jgi:hypothetical protein
MLRIVAIETHRKCWRTLGRKLRTAWTSYVPRKIRMLKLFIILRYWLYRHALSYTFMLHEQFHFVISGLKIISHGNYNNNLESSYIIKIIEMSLNAKFNVALPNITWTNPSAGKTALFSFLLTSTELQRSIEQLLAEISLCWRPRRTHLPHIWLGGNPFE